MTIETSIQSLLAPLATGGAFQDTAPQNTVAPYIVWLEVISLTNNSMLGASDVQNQRIQVDCYALTQATRRQLRDSVLTAFTGASFKNINLSKQNLYEADTKLFRCILEFSVWS
jgi:hypothetical protein